MNRQGTYIVIIILTAVFLFFLSNEFLRGYLRSDEFLAAELKSKRYAIDEYRLASEAPFKYRILFPSIIKGTYSALYEQSDNQGFYNIYKYWSVIFYITSACSMFFLLSTCGFNKRLSFIGAIIFLLLPPMLFAYTLPVHTREDTLAYTIFFIGLIALIKERRLLFLLIALIGALCRETLLLLPLLYLVFSNDNNWIRRLIISGLPVLLWLSLRLLMGHEKYDTLEGLRWNLNNPEQVIGFLFITFNVCWLPFLLRLQNYRTALIKEDKEKLLLMRSSLFALAVILITTFLGGIYNEIRLLYLFCPWIIVIFIDFLKKYSIVIKQVIASKGYWVFVLVCLTLCSTGLYFLLMFREKLIVPGKFAVPYELWIIASMIYIFILLMFLPVSFKVFKIKTSMK